MHLENFLINSKCETKQLFPKNPKKLSKKNLLSRKWVHFLAVHYFNWTLTSMFKLNKFAILDFINKFA